MGERPETFPSQPKPTLADRRVPRQATPHLAARQPPYAPFAAHSTHSVLSGRIFRRPSGISAPQSSQIAVGALVELRERPLELLLDRVEAVGDADVVEAADRLVGAVADPLAETDARPALGRLLQIGEAPANLLEPGSQVVFDVSGFRVHHRCFILPDCQCFRKRIPPESAAAGRRPGDPPKRPASYYVVGGLDLAAETARLCRLEALGGADGRLVAAPPELTIRRASKRPKARLGFAIPEQNRLSVTVYPGIRRGDLLETLLHELVHLAIGASAEGRRWHGREFKDDAAGGDGRGVRGRRRRRSEQLPRRLRGGARAQNGREGRRAAERVSR